MGNKTITITISKPIKFNIEKDGRSGKHFKKELKELRFIEISGPTTSFKSPAIAYNQYEPISHKLDVKKDKKSITVSGSVKVKIEVEPEDEGHYNLCLKKPRLSRISFFTSDNYSDDTHVDFSIEIDKPTPGVKFNLK